MCCWARLPNSLGQMSRAGQVRGRIRIRIMCIFPLIHLVSFHLRRKTQNGPSVCVCVHLKTLNRFLNIAPEYYGRQFVVPDEDDHVELIIWPRRGPGQHGRAATDDHEMLSHAKVYLVPVRADKFAPSRASRRPQIQFSQEEADGSPRRPPPR